MYYLFDIKDLGNPIYNIIIPRHLGSYSVLPSQKTPKMDFNGADCRLQAEAAAPDDYYAAGSKGS